MMTTEEFIGERVMIVWRGEHSFGMRGARLDIRAGVGDLSEALETSPQLACHYAVGPGSALDHRIGYDRLTDVEGTHEVPGWVYDALEKRSEALSFGGWHRTTGVLVESEDGPEVRMDSLVHPSLLD